MSSDQNDIEWDVVHRVVFPGPNEADTLPLYVEFGEAGVAQASTAPQAGGQMVRTESESVATGGAPERVDTDLVISRRRMRVPRGRRASFGTYFNAFPAAYWRAHTPVRALRLTVEVSGASTITVYRSSARGTANRVEGTILASAGLAEFDLPLTQFGDGGWYWFDLVPQRDDVTILAAEWSAPAADRRQRGTLSFAVTTFNRPDYCVKLIETVAAAPELLEFVDVLQITDQGTKRVRDESGYEHAAAALGDKLRIVEQGNLGGSGGYARGMHDAKAAGTSDYVLLLDDDVLVEPESILRALQVADFTRKPMLIGGQMLSLYERTMLHTFGERVNFYRFIWGPAPGVMESHDFAIKSLRSTAWLHRRIDVDYNGWWMCLIPMQVVRELGLSMPYFIKWDDSEFGFRAAAAGYGTITMPGVAIWHMPWTEKDDTLDWQAYFHARNRFTSAAIYSKYPRSGGLIRESLLFDLRHLLSMQYSAVELRHMGLAHVLAGPKQLHAGIGTILAEVNKVRKQFPDARVEKEPGLAFPAVKRTKLLKRGVESGYPRSRVGAVLRVVTGSLRQLRAVKPNALEHPEATVAAIEAKWWRLSQYDSALVSAADGSGASWYQRQPETFWRQLRRSLLLHARLYVNWNRLQRSYQKALPRLVSDAEWEKTFAGRS